MEDKKSLLSLKKEETTTQAPKQEPSYEDLKNWCHQLSEQARTLYQKLQEANLTNMFKRLDYLFAVVENKDAFPDEFTKKCIEEIVTSMTLEEKAEEAEPNKE